MSLKENHSILSSTVIGVELWNRIVSHVQRSQLTGPLCIWVVPCEPVDLMLRHDHDNVHSAQYISLCKLSSVTETLINAWRSPKSIVCFWTQQSTTCMWDDAILPLEMFYWPQIKMEGSVCGVIPSWQGSAVQRQMGEFRHQCASTPVQKYRNTQIHG